ncbi:MAG: peptidase M22 [Acutalibacteraceae bacterium]|nr:peptidase M22 [Acutalibacteraceae bacterium]
MNSMSYLAIDTSNYTTSVAYYNGIDILQAKKLLPVKQGQLGLRQSDAVFHHTIQLPMMIEELAKKTDINNISAIGASFTPRSIEGSYMPCFNVGSGMARSISSILNVPLYRFSHQQGHIAAAIYSSGRLELFKEKHIAFHVSGGTTEALIVTPDNENIISATLVGKTLDLNAGQLVDRVGVMLGLQFPCGKQIEQLALNFIGRINVNPTIKGCDCCISGVENICSKMYKNNISDEEISAFVLKYIEETLYRMTLNIFNEYGKMPILFSGGVMSNSIIRDNLTKRLSAFFAKPEFSTDNAAGIAVLTALKNKEEII